MIQHGAGEEIAVFKRMKRLYDLRWQATNNLVLYELGACVKIQENEKELEVQLLV